MSHTGIDNGQAFVWWQLSASLAMRVMADDGQTGEPASGKWV